MRDAHRVLTGEGRPGRGPEVVSLQAAAEDLLAAVNAVGTLTVAAEASPSDAAVEIPGRRRVPGPVLLHGLRRSAGPVGDVGSG